MKKYRPSSGTEGGMFMAEFCYQCKKESRQKPCEILSRSFYHLVDDPGYPDEWIYDCNDNPVCTAFERKN